MSKNKTTETPTKAPKSTNRKDAIIGVLQMFVVVSIVYMVAVIFMGTDGYAAKAMTAPAALYAAFLIFAKFTKK